MLVSMRLPPLFMVSLALALPAISPGFAAANEPAPVVTIEGLGRGLVSLDQRWQCALYTDGLLEARADSGEIFSFEQLGMLLSHASDAVAASAAAVEFGQEDDITVLTLTRSK